MAEILVLQRFAREAQALKEFPAYQRAYDKLYAAALDDIRFSKPAESARREEAYWRLRTLEALDQELIGVTKGPGLETRRQDSRERLSG